jgi:hypothetical protein
MCVAAVDLSCDLQKQKEKKNGKLMEKKSRIYGFWILLYD